MLDEFKYACRMLWKTPAFTAIAVLTLALGIGANTAIFTVVHGVLLRPLPYPQPEELVTLKSNQSVPELDDLISQNRSFAGLGGLGLQAADYANGGEPQQLELGLVAGDFFRVLGAPTALGRTLSAEDDRFGRPSVVVLSHAFWIRQLASDPAVRGKPITLAGQSYNIVGITTADFRSPRGNPDAFVPVHVFYPLAAKSRGAHLLRVVGRLRPGVSINAAQANLRALDQWLAQTFPDEEKSRLTSLISLHERLVGDVRPALLVLFGAVGLVLLIACGNFANLLLVRVEARRQELTIRAALGAGRAHLIRQILLESVLLAILGGGAGLLLGGWGVEALLALRPEELPPVDSISLDASVLLFTFALALVTGIVFGILPAWQATRLEVAGMVPSSVRSVTPARSNLRGALVIAELSLALVLLIGAGLLGKTFSRLTSIAPGFNPANVLTLRTELPESRYREVARQTQFREQVLGKMNQLPGVQAAMISELPLAGDSINHNFLIEGRAPPALGEAPELYSRTIAGDYFQVLGIPILQGRGLTRSDRANAPLVGVINQSMARQYFPGQDALGTRIRWAHDEGVSWITIVGVVGNVRHFGLAEAEAPAIYTPYAQSGQAWKRWSEFVVRSAAVSDQQTLATRLKECVWAIDPSIPVTKIRSMTEIMAVSLAERRFNALLLGIFAGVALLLASVGLYGVLAFTVGQRTREIGIRMALGAQAGDVLRMIFAQDLRLTFAGVLIGLAVSLASTRILARFLYGVAPTDPATFAALALVAVAWLACFLPARRALKVDPITALRYE